MPMEAKTTRRGYRVWRALDQPSAFFGIKGRFMVLFLILAGVGALIGLSIGSSMGNLVGMIVIGLLIFCDYMLILSIQGKMSDGEFSRMVCKGNLPRYVKVMPGCIVSSLKTPALWK